MNGTLDVVVLDCPDPRALARLSAELVGGELVGAELVGGALVDHDADRAEVAPPITDHRPILASQQVADHRAPEWPGQDD
jgi:hypothetical protein